MLKRQISIVICLIALAVAQAHAQTVYVSRTGKSYHTSETCFTLKRSKTVSAITLEEAEKRGLKPCKFCARPKN